MAKRKPPPHGMHPLVEALRMERHRQRLTQRQLAARIGYDKSSIGHAETSYHTPTITFFAEWAQGLGFELQLSRFKHEGD